MTDGRLGQAAEVGSAFFGGEFAKPITKSILSASKKAVKKTGTVGQKVLQKFKGKKTRNTDDAIVKKEFIDTYGDDV